MWAQKYRKQSFFFSVVLKKKKLTFADVHSCLFVIMSSHTGSTDWARVIAPLRHLESSSKHLMLLLYLFFLIGVWRFKQSRAASLFVRAIIMIKTKPWSPDLNACLRVLKSFKYVSLSFIVAWFKFQLLSFARTISIDFLFWFVLLIHQDWNCYILC